MKRYASLSRRREFTDSLLLLVTASRCLDGGSLNARPCAVLSTSTASLFVRATSGPEINPVNRRTNEGMELGDIPRNA